LWIGLILRPMDNHFSRSYKDTQVIDVSVGIVVSINSQRKPNTFSTPK